MTPEQKQQIKDCLKTIAEIMYENAPPAELQSFEKLETYLRQQILQEVGPELAKFFFSKAK